MEEIDAREAWNTGAEGFIAFVESGADYYRHLVHGPALLAACGDVGGKTALDLGCGQGYFSRLLAREGAVVAGIDVADKLLARAMELEAQEPLGITYLRMDAGQIASRFEAETFDLVTGCMSLQDMAHPPAVLAAAGGVLKREGRALFSVPHPCTDPPHRVWQRDEQGNKVALCLDRYFETGPAVTDWSMARLKYRWQTPFHRYTLTEWSGLIRDAGFFIRDLREPRPSAELAAAHRELDDCWRMPFFLIFELMKGTRGH
jgi:ubiquinone/menaquinone biosynthesis C-methylase UbiE